MRERATINSSQSRPASKPHPLALSLAQQATGAAGELENKMKYKIENRFGDARDSKLAAAAERVLGCVDLADALAVLRTELPGWGIFKVGNRIQVQTVDANMKRRLVVTP